MEVLQAIDSAFIPDINILHDENFNLLGFMSLTESGTQFIRDNSERLLNGIGKSIDLLLILSNVCIQYTLKREEG